MVVSRQKLPGSVRTCWVGGSGNIFEDESVVIIAGAPPPLHDPHHPSPELTPPALPLNSTALTTLDPNPNAFLQWNQNDSQKAGREYLYYTCPRAMRLGSGLRVIEMARACACMRIASGMDDASSADTD